jgi:ABC-2 type transport system permease protein
LSWRKAVLGLLGIVAVATAGTGLVGGCISTKFFLPMGLLLALVGLGYLWAFFGFFGTDSDEGYRAIQGIALAGLIVFLVGLVRSILTRYGWLGVERDLAYLPTAGSLLMGMGILYVMWAVLFSSDAQVVVVARRELGAFFYTPVAYILMIGLAIVAWFGYYLFVFQVFAEAQFGGALVEPIVMQYIFGIIPVFFFLLQVPLLTMRLFSEEASSGTLEMLMTVPMQEITIVLGKFWAVMVIYLMTWLPFGLYLLALRVVGGEPFDYRPIISFIVAVICSGAGAIAVGLFFSCLSKSQLVSLMLTGMFMMALLFGFLAALWVQQIPEGLKVVLRYVTPFELWRQALRGDLILGNLFFPIAVTIAALFAAVKVLEARKWW